MANLERTSIEEREALVTEHKDRLLVLTEELREAAKEEIHATARSALTESDAQFKTISAMRKKILKLRLENNELRTSLGEHLSRESVLRASLDQMTSVSEKRALALRRVVERAMEQSDVRKDLEKAKDEKETLKRDLHQTQLQLDTATKLSCDIRETSSEKSIALDLLSAKLQEERKDKKRVSDALYAALQVLQENIFSDRRVKEGRIENKDILNLTLKRLVDILSEAEQSLTISEEDNKEYSLAEIGERRRFKGEPLATYTAGDLGLVPKNERIPNK